MRKFSLCWCLFYVCIHLESTGKWFSYIYSYTHTLFSLFFIYFRFPFLVCLIPGKGDRTFHNLTLYCSIFSIISNLFFPVSLFCLIFCDTCFTFHDLEMVILEKSSGIFLILFMVENVCSLFLMGWFIPYLVTVIITGQIGFRAFRIIKYHQIVTWDNNRNRKLQSLNVSFFLILFQV